MDANYYTTITFNYTAFYVVFYFTIIYLNYIILMGVKIKNYQSRHSME